MFPIRDHNPSGTVPYVTYALIAANILVFLVSLPMEGNSGALASFYNDWALFPDRIADGRGLPGLVTSMFLHAGLMHLAGNMLFLWIFGDNMEDAWGHLGFLVFYLLCGIGAGLAHVIAAPWSGVPTVGASGAIAGVLGGYLLLYPKARVDILLILIVFFRVFSLPAWIILGLWFGFQIVAGVGTPTEGGGVAYWAHAGGFVLGFLFTLPLWLRLGGSGFWQSSHGHPPHPEAAYPDRVIRVPVITRRR